jgi:hypothetical protein
MIALAQVTISGHKNNCQWPISPKICNTTPKHGMTYFGALVANWNYRNVHFTFYISDLILTVFLDRSSTLQTSVYRFGTPLLTTLSPSTPRQLTIRIKP